MMTTIEWFKRQSEYNRDVYERLHANNSDLADWKVTVLFYSALHRVNYWFAVQTGRAPSSHFERNRRVGGELPRVFGHYKFLYLMSRRARYCEGFRIKDDARRHSVEVLGLLEKEIPFL